MHIHKCSTPPVFFKKKETKNSEMPSSTRVDSLMYMINIDSRETIIVRHKINYVVASLLTCYLQQ